jgi:hypothetical protein
MKKIYSRRHIFFQIAGISVAYMGRRHSSALVSNDGLIEASIFARRAGASNARTIDVWTARCGNIDAFQLSEAIGLVAVWDDILLKRDARRSVGKIASAIAEYFAIEHDRDGCHMSVHLSDVGRASSSLNWIFDPKEFAELHRNGVAIIDVGACGITGLDWTDLIPRLNQLYRTVIGVGVCWSELHDFDPEFYCKPHFTSQRSWRSLTLCDHSLIVSGDSFSSQAELSHEEVSARFTAYLNKIASAILGGESIEQALAGKFSEPSVVFRDVQLRILG